MPLFKPICCLFSKSLLSAKIALKSLCIQENSFLGGEMYLVSVRQSAVLKTHLLKTV